MEVLDEDVQMVRDWLAQADAPEFIKGHFDNIVEQHAKEADRAETLQEQLTTLESEESAAVEKLQSELNELQDQFDEIVGDGMLGALECVRNWMHDVLYLGRPMTDPRKILRIVEDAL
jgi:lysyl-tRNA synthetase class I